jgi:hypothetical protein
MTFTRRRARAGQVRPGRRVGLTEGYHHRIRFSDRAGRRHRDGRKKKTRSRPMPAKREDSVQVPADPVAYRRSKIDVAGQRRAGPRPSPGMPSNSSELVLPGSGVVRQCPSGAGQGRPGSPAESGQVPFSLRPRPVARNVKKKERMN